MAEHPLSIVRSTSALEIGAPVLEVRELVKEFLGTRALSGVNLTVRYGEIHALLGENGAGKTTLIKTIVGALQPTEGTILIDSAPVRFGSPVDAQEAGIAVVHQHSNLVSTLSVEENLWLGRPLPRLAGALINWAAMRRRAMEILDYVGSSVKPGAMLSDLRPDERAMISIARAIASDARLIILDEPTAALLPDEVDTLFQQMRRLAREGLGFLYVSHRLTEVMEIADRVSVLRDGRNAGSFDRDSMDRRAVIAAIVGPTKELELKRPCKIGGRTCGSDGFGTQRRISCRSKLCRADRRDLRNCWPARQRLRRNDRFAVRSQTDPRRHR